MVLVPALPAFHARHPEIQLDLGVSDRKVDLIGENVDCVIRGGELQDQSLRARRVADLRLGVYASPGYLAMAGVPRHPGELEDSHHRIVGYLWARLGRALPYAMQRGDERLRVHGRYALAVDDGNAYLQAGLAGLGILWLPTTWRGRIWPAASWRGCSRTGTWKRCRCTWPIRPTATSAPSCAPSSTGSWN